MAHCVPMRSTIASCSASSSSSTYHATDDDACHSHPTSATRVGTTHAPTDPPMPDRRAPRGGGSPAHRRSPTAASAAPGPALRPPPPVAAAAAAQLCPRACPVLPPTAAGTLLPSALLLVGRGGAAHPNARARGGWRWLRRERPPPARLKGVRDHRRGGGGGRHTRFV
jgi:hypothetical protein